MWLVATHFAHSAFFYVYICLLGTLVTELCKMTELLKIPFGQADSWIEGTIYHIGEVTLAPPGEYD